MAPVALFGFVAFLFLDVGHELTSTLIILLCRRGPVCVIGESRFIVAITGGVKAIFAVGVLVG
jgi:hypothetical protein